jgi:hypothetical protein
MLREDAALQGITLLSRHTRHVERIARRLLVLRLLELPPVDELHVGNGYSSGFAGVFVLEAAAKRGENLRPIIVER